MTPPQPIFHSLGLLVETVQKEEEALQSHRCSEAPGHELVGKRGTGVCVLESARKGLQFLERMIKLPRGSAYVQFCRKGVKMKKKWNAFEHEP